MTNLKEIYTKSDEEIIAIMNQIPELERWSKIAGRSTHLLVLVNYYEENNLIELESYDYSKDLKVNPENHRYYVDGESYQRCLDMLKIYNQSPDIEINPVPGYLLTRNNTVIFEGDEIPEDAVVSFEIKHKDGNGYGLGTVNPKTLVCG